MDRYEALEAIKNMWNDSEMELGTRIIEISRVFYDVGLDVPTTAAFIHSTPSELDALLALGALDEETIRAVSEVNPPKTTWTLIANASDEEIHQALLALTKAKSTPDMRDIPFSEFVYKQMLEVAAPTVEQLVSGLSGEDMAHAYKKAQDFGALSEWEDKFFKSVAAQKKRGKTLSGKQVDKVVMILDNLYAKGVIKRNSIDGDEEICNRILDALGK